MELIPLMAKVEDGKIVAIDKWTEGSDSLDVLTRDMKYLLEKKINGLDAAYMSINRILSELKVRIDALEAKMPT